MPNFILRPPMAADKTRPLELPPLLRREPELKPTARSTILAAVMAEIRRVPMPALRLPRSRDARCRGQSQHSPVTRRRPLVGTRHADRPPARRRGESCLQERTASMSALGSSTRCCHPAAPAAPEPAHAHACQRTGRGDPRTDPRGSAPARLL